MRLARHIGPDRLQSVVGLAALAVVAAAVVPDADDDTAAKKGAGATSSAEETVAATPRGALTDRETFIGAYGGAPYTYPSAVRIEGGPDTRFVIDPVAWDAKPFDHPIYYGVRIARWSRDSSFGSLLDFTHSKAYAQRSAPANAEGMLNGQPVPKGKTIGDIFHHFEFTHGHNMLTLNGLFRLPFGTAMVKPYVGLGAGVSLPHTEVQYRGVVGKRTYEYQYTGPAVQALIGIELRIPRLSYFVEYKLSFADYLAPLHQRDGTTLFADLWHQMTRWWSGVDPKGGWLATPLLSHNAIAGMGVRIGDSLTPAAP